MTTTVRQFWHDPEFREFLPYIKVQPAHDTNAGRNRLELMQRTPVVLIAQALVFRGPCARCGRLINIFRSRNAEAQRGKTGNVYLAACCPLSVNVGCSRGGAASAAYEAIAVLALDAQRSDRQGGLL